MAPGTEILPHPTAGCCHLANLMVLFSYYYYRSTLEVSQQQL